MQLQVVRMTKDSFTSKTSANMPNRKILGSRVDCMSCMEAARQVVKWSHGKKARVVCAANTHMLMEAWDDPVFAEVLANADLVVADGVPLVLALKAFGLPQASRVYGPALALEVCAAAADQNVPIALYGGDRLSLDKTAEHLEKCFPSLNIACRSAPPFRPLTDSENERYTRKLVESGSRIILVGIGCPKQEIWMHEHRHDIPAVMIGVGAAFNFFAGRVRQAPAWMQKCSLEWLFRLCMEPKRLWKRYLKNNPRFLVLFMAQCIKHFCKPRST